MPYRRRIPIKKMKHSMVVARYVFCLVALVAISVAGAENADASGTTSGSSSRGSRYQVKNTGPRPKVYSRFDTGSHGSGVSRGGSSTKGGSGNSESKPEENVNPTDNQNGEVKPEGDDSPPDSQNVEEKPEGTDNTPGSQNSDVKPEGNDSPTDGQKGDEKPEGPNDLPNDQKSGSNNELDEARKRVCDNIRKRKQEEGEGKKGDGTEDKNRDSNRTNRTEGNSNRPTPRETGYQRWHVALCDYEDLIKPKPHEKPEMTFLAKVKDATEQYIKKLQHAADWIKEKIKELLGLGDYMGKKPGRGHTYPHRRVHTTLKNGTHNNFGIKYSPKPHTGPLNDENWSLEMAL